MRSGKSGATYFTRRILHDVFIVNMSNEVPTELCRSTKLLCHMSGETNTPRRIKFRAVDGGGTVLTVIRAVLLRNVLLSLQHGMPRVIFVGKPDTMSRRAVGRGSVGLIHEDGTEGELIQNDPKKNVSNYGSSIGWVIDSNAVAPGWDSDSSTDYVDTSVRRKQEQEL